MSSSLAHHTFSPRSITDRAWWTELAAKPYLSKLIGQIEQEAEAVPVRTLLPTASDYLAANRKNDRNVLDRHWRQDRRMHTVLAVRRALKGIDPNDPDDPLLDWTYALATEPSWTVSAHLPERDLKPAARPVLDLASCEMAAHFAEFLEVMAPWIASASGSLCDTIRHEIDTRILSPYADGFEVWWDQPKRVSNWLGVCAGSLLVACESLAAQGHPRPAARERALKGLVRFFDDAFTKDGECDEGVAYWNYGVGFACLGLSRLSREELESRVDMNRFWRIADYPRRAHLFGNTFFCGNDGGMETGTSLSFVPWLAAASGNPWLPWWAHHHGQRDGWLFTQMLRSLAAPEVTAEAAAQAAASDPANGDAPEFLADQQTGILHGATPKGKMTAILSGGNNAERHNHNDLGHFVVALNGEVVVPDLGAPQYTADFFGPKRYTYLSASSRGHCCLLVGEHEQRAGEEAAAKVLAWEPKGEIPRLSLELAAAYPPEAGLTSWVRTLERWPASEEKQKPLRFVITDVVKAKKPGEKITHVVWSLYQPQSPVEQVEGTGMRFRLGPVDCEFSPAPYAVGSEAVDPTALRLRIWQDRTLYRIEVVYRAGEDGKLAFETRFLPAGV